MAIDIAKNSEPDLRSEQECFPTIDPGIEVQGDRVLVQLRREKNKSKGGILLVEETRQTIKYNEWRDNVALPAVIKRDGELCFDCRSKVGVHLHHIKSRGAHPELKYDLDNLVLLCSYCHRKRHRQL